MSSPGVTDLTAQLQWLENDQNPDFVDLPSINLLSKTESTPTSSVTPQEIDPATLPEIPGDLPATPAEVSASIQTELPTLEGLPQKPAFTPAPAVNPSPAFIAAPIMPTHTVPINLWDHYLHLVMSHPLKAFLTISLTIESLYGLLESVGFVTREYPMIESRLRAHELTASELNILVTRIVIIIISTVLSAFFALKLNFNKTKTAEELHLVVSIILFFFNIYLFTSFSQLPVSQILQELGDAFSTLLLNL